ncbi:MAG: DUF4221 domain-containing protein [Flavobacteriales bacterium]|nr:DUF4221 domain-containing protein [Flavobacteriales bacterium]
MHKRGNYYFKIYFHSIFVFICFILVSCSEQNKAKDSGLSFYYEIIQFHGKYIDSLLKNTPIIYLDISNDANGNADILIADNYLNNSVWFISLIDTNVGYKVKYPENHNISLSTHHVARLNNDFYWIDGLTSNLYLYHWGDTVFRFVETLNTNLDLVAEGLEVWPSLICSSNIRSCFFIGDSLLAFPCLSRVDGNGTYVNAVNNFPFTGFYNIYTKKIKFSKFKYPPIFEKKYYGMLSKFFQVYDNHRKIYYYSPALTQIFTYDILSDKIDSFNIRSKYQNEEIPFFNIDSPDLIQHIEQRALVNHNRQSPNYRRLFISPDGKLFYRIFKNGTSNVNFLSDNNSSNENYDDYYLIVFNNKYQILTEFKLPKEAFIYSVFAFNDGIYIMYSPKGKSYDEGLYWLKISIR